ncbi:zinc finger protein 208 isoform X2 [Manduca sexta]|uniref:zinc finger protein 208 isoform X2 n=1 Tax=Manduca sexta TaxID=7130 RepID=UPI00188F62BD|nr:zinc finger protein 208 isoform X2 [Manduca sexta]
MINNIFFLKLSNLDGEAEERLICATCVTRLRDASAFRQQVLCCEQALLQTTIHIHGADGEKKSVKDESEETSVKAEVDIEVVEPVSPQHQAEDNMDNEAGIVEDDVETVESETETKPKTILKQKKKIKLKSKKKSKNKTVDNNETCRQKRKPQKFTKPLANLEHKVAPVKTQLTPRLDNEHQSFRNAVTLVENSYVCPFDTSFSDYFCIYCREVFTDPDKLREHTLTHDPGTFKDLVPNKKLLQVDIYRIDCRLCSRSIQSMDLLKQHLVVDHEKIVYPVENEFLKYRLTLTNLSCLECGASFSFFHALKKHMAEHFGTCICDVCGAHYFEERMLTLHQKTHQKIEESFPCHCGKVFKSKHSRYLHEARIHKKEPAYQCTKCDEVLFSYSLRYRHMIEVHGEHRLFPCEHCDRAYVSRKSLREHNRRFHLKIFKHQCDLCDKRFYLPSRLKEHMATHTGERNFRCEYCGKSYPRLRGLKVHMQSHSTEKKFGCVMCNATFSQNVNLKNHMKKHHESLEIEEGYHE